MIEQNKLAEIQSEVDSFLYEFQEVKIATIDEYTQWSDRLKVVQNKIKKVEDKRMEYTRPLDESKKKIMADFKSITEPLEEFVKVVKSEMIRWHNEDQARKDAEQAEIEAKALKLAKEQGISEVQVEVINQEQKTQRGAVSAATVRTVWTFEVEDETQIPREYLVVDESAIRKAVQGGLRRIPGVKIYEEKQLSIR